ncbi:hypothetical protein GCM10023351_28540 [Microbacterium gilvum]|uniref:Uncharacterized protein n=1 Tax=Microbacterium gilvum TaxID=1336204 RepID=A0ABP9AHS3_9MICO
MVTTQVYDAWVPPSSGTMIGSEVPTTVVETMEQNIARRRPERASSTWRRDIRAAVACVSVECALICAFR